MTTPKKSTRRENILSILDITYSHVDNRGSRQDLIDVFAKHSDRTLQTIVDRLPELIDLSKKGVCITDEIHRSSDLSIRRLTAALDNLPSFEKFFTKNNDGKRKLDYFLSELTRSEPDSLPKDITGGQVANLAKKLENIEPTRTLKAHFMKSCGVDEFGLVAWNTFKIISETAKAIAPAKAAAEKPVDQVLAVA